jgi:hypothetical protein
MEALIMADIIKFSYYGSKYKFRFVVNFFPPLEGLTEKPAAKES